MSDMGERMYLELAEKLYEEHADLDAEPWAVVSTAVARRWVVIAVLAFEHVDKVRGIDDPEWGNHD